MIRKNWTEMAAGWFRGKIWFLARTLSLVVLAAGLWGFAGKRQRSRVVNKVDIRIENEAENHFVDAELIENTISKGRNNMVFMRWYDSVSLYRLEKKIEKIDFVSRAEASHDLGGNLHIRVRLVKPVARIISGGSDLDRYLGPEGELLPTSEKYASRVITIDGPGSRKMAYQGFMNDSTCRAVLGFIRKVSEDPFWKAQIAHVYINENMELTLYPLVGNQEIEFGPADEVDKKLRKLETYYQQIIPARGWNAFRKVSVKYRNQIVCQKNLIE